MIIMILIMMTRVRFALKAMRLMVLMMLLIIMMRVRCDPRHDDSDEFDHIRIRSESGAIRCLMIMPIMIMVLMMRVRCDTMHDAHGALEIVVVVIS